MSCQINGQRANLSAERTGLSRLQSGYNYALGQTLASVQRGLGQASTTALRLTESFDPPSPEALYGAAVLGAALYKGRDGRNFALNAAGAAKVASALSGGLGAGLVRLTRDKGGQIEERFFFKTNTPARFWASKLTPWFNSAEVGLLGKATASQGQMIETGGQAWHYGLVKLETNRGERTAAHLQSLRWPAQHYYFNRPLSEPEAVGVISGQKGFDPKQLPGYVGQIAPGESLHPAWAAAKTGLIRTNLLYGEAQS